MSEPSPPRVKADSLAASVRVLVCAVLALSVAAVAGCGGSDGGEGAAVDLTKRLPADADFYSTVDLGALRQGLDLPDDADPLDGDLLSFSGPLGILAQFGDPDVTEALELPQAFALATAVTADGPVTAIATHADTGEIGSTLGDLGFEDQGGVLSGGDSQTLAVRLDDGAIYLARDAEGLEGIDREPADDPPRQLLEELDAPLIQTTPSPDCARESAITANADGSGEIAYLIDGGADASRLAPPESDVDDRVTFGEPQVDGDLITLMVEAEGDGNVLVAQQVQAQLFLVYEC